MDPVSNKAIKCDLCGDSEPACAEICPSRVLGALDDAAVAEFNRRKTAALLAIEDEFLRGRPGGEDPVMKKLEKKG
jgi:Fe-S-cluster-containing hydrogenase component 2